MPPPTGPQMPTHLNVRVRTIDEARLVLHAVALALPDTPIVRGRLQEHERWAIREGSVFVWEERTEPPPASDSDAQQATPAISRWTDGRRWGPSRVKDDFLIYHENLPALPPDTREADRLEFFASRLIKQTYSAWVELRGRRRKWHLVAYYTQKTDRRLTPVSSVPLFAALRGTFSPDQYVSARAPKTRGRSNSHPSDDGGGGAGEGDADGDDSDLAIEPAAAAGPSSTRERAGTPVHFTPSAPAPAPAPGRHDASPGGGKECALAPLVYDRLCPYPPRHPVDSVALRSLDVRVRIL